MRRRIVRDCPCTIHTHTHQYIIQFVYAVAFNIMKCHIRVVFTVFFLCFVAKISALLLSRKSILSACAPDIWQRNILTARWAYKRAFHVDEEQISSIRSFAPIGGGKLDSVYYIHCHFKCALVCIWVFSSHKSQSTLMSTHSSIYCSPHAVLNPNIGDWM